MDRLVSVAIRTAPTPEPQAKIQQTDHEHIFSQNDLDHQVKIDDPTFYPPPPYGTLGQRPEP